MPLICGSRNSKIFDFIISSEFLLYSQVGTFGDIPAPSSTQNETPTDIVPDYLNLSMSSK